MCVMDGEFLLPLEPHVTVLDRNSADITWWSRCPSMAGDDGDQTASLVAHTSLSEGRMQMSQAPGGSSANSSVGLEWSLCVGMFWKGYTGCSYPVWEDFSAKATKLHAQLRFVSSSAVSILILPCPLLFSPPFKSTPPLCVLYIRTTVLATVAFLDAFQKVADMATNTRGATRDIGSALTRMCMRHRSIETKLRLFTNALMESLITPLQDRIEEWKKTANQLDKDHAKGASPSASQFAHPPHPLYQ
ncbi:hypothetical protein Z043_111628 [Scleropages formosus]|uniref:IMD domain-containing protein n=1 Tax=Scleropages formosus TaxID=113540 RepID=A0A0P7YP05_SCLFO|nr:hypothetical protein Z043_111628 [Scleropages formosus]